jgi:hypothetical protein
MLKRLAKLVLLTTLLVLPVQGTAAALAQILCATQDHHAVQAHSHADHDHGTPHQHAGSEGSGGEGHSAHFCCTHIVTGAPLGVVIAAQIAFPVYHPSSTPLHSLFVPEQPQRPPRG